MRSLLGLVLLTAVSTVSAGPALDKAAHTLSDVAERGVSLTRFDYSEGPRCPQPAEGRCEVVGAAAITAEWQHAVSTVGRTEVKERLGRDGLSDALYELLAMARAAGPYTRCETHVSDGKTFQRKVTFNDHQGKYCPAFTLGYED